MDHVIPVLNESRLFWGITTLVVNMGSRYVMSDITLFQEAILKTELGKTIIIFCMCFMGSRDVLISAILTFTFMIVIQTWLNEKSKYNLLPKSITERFLIDKII